MKERKLIFVKFLLLSLSLLLLKSSLLTNNYWLDWLVDVLMFILRKESRLLIAIMNSQFFISDQMCPVVVLHCKTSTAKILSLYSSTVSAIHCFVIQPLSEPQKLNLCSLFKVWLTYRIISFYRPYLAYNLITQNFKPFQNQCLCKMKDTMYMSNYNNL